MMKAVKIAWACMILLWLLHAAVSTLQPQIKNTPKKMHTQAGY